MTTPIDTPDAARSKRRHTQIVSTAIVAAALAAGLAFGAYTSPDAPANAETNTPSESPTTSQSVNTTLTPNDTVACTLCVTNRRGGGGNLPGPR